MECLGYWAKTSKESGAYTFHPVAYHGLDVAAVGLELLRVRPRGLSQLSTVSGIDPAALEAWLPFLLATHDMGKMADGFQGLAPELQVLLQERASRVPYTERHDLLGFRLWKEVLGSRVCSELLPLSPSCPYRDWIDLVEPWLWATAGHHGEPPRGTGVPADLGEQFPPGAAEDAWSLVESLVNLFLPDGMPFGLEPFREQRDRFRRTSWLVAGWSVAADWIGSNVEWFPFVMDEMDLLEYWEGVALPRARRAVELSGMTTLPASTASGVETLWPAIRTPTDLQLLASRITVGRGPELFIIEEVTGGGKTEAALALAHRLMEKGKGSGIFVALPTMATANAMHGRIRQVFRRFYAGESQPSLVLAHGKSHLALQMEAVVCADDTDRGTGRSGTEEAAAWLADSRKKALLADIGVGTIDQALLSVLPIRHQSLRLWGLASKILIVDEVHACDEYVRRLLESTLEFHAGFGGSVILLSATLPANQRKSLVEAFSRGAGNEATPIDLSARDYPLTTKWSVGGGLAEHPTVARAEASRRVEVHLVSEVEEVERRISTVVEEGGCACWVRNTVGDAIDAYDRWRSRLGADRVSLFHSRFTVGDRAGIEEEILRRFGPESGKAERSGRLLIATQVVEQSLDLDFDFMVTDLTMIDLIIQRAGREHRHRRSSGGDRSGGDDGRGSAVLAVLAPKPEPDAPETWFEDLFPSGAWVYPDHGRLWLTARWLADHGGFGMPEDARSMIEFVYGDDAERRMPVGLQGRSDRAAEKAREEGFSGTSQRPRAG